MYVLSFILKQYKAGHSLYQLIEEMNFIKKNANQFGLSSNYSKYWILY